MRFHLVALICLFGSTFAAAQCAPPVESGSRKTIDTGHLVIGVVLLPKAPLTAPAPPSAGLSQARRKPGTVLITLHGDLTSGCPADYHTAFTRDAVGRTLPGVAMIRPGYRDGTGLASTGRGGRDSYTAQNIDAVAAAIGRLKTYYRREVVLMGHSGGAAMAGVILGRHPGLVRTAVLVSWPCDVPQWRAMTGGQPWPNSLSPSDFTGTVPASTRVIAITGAADTNTAPVLADAYVNSLIQRGVSARHIVVPGAQHNLNGALRGQALQTVRQFLLP